jgi:hypothetical protein
MVMGFPPSFVTVTDAVIDVVAGDAVGVTVDSVGVTDNEPTRVNRPLTPSARSASLRRAASTSTSVVIVSKVEG